MATSPQFSATPKIGLAQVSTANTNRDGTGTVVDILTAGTNGTRVESVTITATGTTTAGVIRLYLYDGSNTRLYAEITVDANVPSTSNPVWTKSLTLGFVLPTTWKLRASTHVAETFNVAAFGGDF